MFGIGPWEVVAIVVVAVIFVRPSDLPRLLRRAGRFVAQLRSLRDDIEGSLSQIEREVEAEAQDSSPGKAGTESAEDGRSPG